MKKLLSILLIISILCSLPCLQAFAATSTTPTTSLTELEKETLPIEEYEDFTILDELPSYLDQCDSILSTDTIFSQNQSRVKISIYFNETSKTFLQKITADTLSINGYITEKNCKSVSLNDYFFQNKLSRFDIVELAYQKNLITESEKIETYCTLIENQQFENASCLHGVVLMLQQYQLSETGSNEIKQRIEQIFSPFEATSHNTSARSVDKYENYLSYSSDNFIVKYESSIACNEVIEVANYLETVRNKYVNEMGYRAPIPESTQTKYRVILVSEASEDENENEVLLGLTTPKDFSGVTCSTYIEIFYFSSLTTQFKEVIAHELFHAIQAAYYKNQWLANIWFSEATAAWATIEIQETTPAISEQINEYLACAESLVYFYDMGAVLFPLVMQALCGTRDVIREVWEEYGTLTSNNSTLGDLREIIDNTLSPYGKSFDDIYLTMGYYNFSPSYWYSSLHPSGSTVTDTWIPRIDTLNNTYSQPKAFIVVTNTTHNPTHSIPLHSHQYHKFVPDIIGQNSKITIEVNFSGNDAAKGSCHFYYVKADGTQTGVKLPRTGTNKYVIVSDTYGSNILWCGMVISNTSTQNEINYSIKYHVERGSTQSVSFYSNLRYYEKAEDIENGDYRDFLVTFATGGTKLIQTFGTMDTFIELYNENNDRVARNDDNGDRLNALISYSVTANTQYRIRVMYNTHAATGRTKLVIIPSASYSTYESIPAYTDSTSNISGTYTQYQANLFTYKCTTQQTLITHLESNVDSYLYIINPRSADLITRADNITPSNTQNSQGLYNDDYNTTTASQITKTMLANVPYLIIVCKYNPSYTINGGYYLTFN